MGLWRRPVQLVIVTFSEEFFDSEGIPQNPSWSLRIPQGDDVLEWGRDSFLRSTNESYPLGSLLCRSKKLMPSFSEFTKQMQTRKWSDNGQVRLALYLSNSWPLVRLRGFPTTVLEEGEARLGHVREGFLKIPQNPSWTWGIVRDCEGFLKIPHNEGFLDSFYELILEGEISQWLCDHPMTCRLFSQLG